VRPLLTYGSVVWSHSFSKLQVKKLAQVQRLALINISRSMRSTPSVGLEAALGFIPIDLYLKREATKTRHRISKVKTSVSWNEVMRRRRGVHVREMQHEKAKIMHEWRSRECMILAFEYLIEDISIKFFSISLPWV